MQVRSVTYDVSIKASNQTNQPTRLQRIKIMAHGIKYCNNGVHKFIGLGTVLIKKDVLAFMTEDDLPKGWMHYKEFARKADISLQRISELVKTGVLAHRRHQREGQRGRPLLMIAVTEVKRVQEFKDLVKRAAELGYKAVPKK